MPKTYNDPRTKEEFLDRLLRYDFDGDIRSIGAEPASLVRTGPNSLEISFPKSGKTYELTVHRPRSDRGYPMAPFSDEERQNGRRIREAWEEPLPPETVQNRRM